MIAKLEIWGIGSIVTRLLFRYVKRMLATYPALARPGTCGAEELQWWRQLSMWMSDEGRKVLAYHITEV